MRRDLHVTRDSRRVTNYNKVIRAIVFVLALIFITWFCILRLVGLRVHGGPNNCSLVEREKGMTVRS